MTGGRGFAASATLLHLFDLGGLVGAIGVNPIEPQRPIDSRLPVAKGVIVEDLALLAHLKGEEGVADALNVLFAELAVLLAQVLA